MHQIEAAAGASERDRRVHHGLAAQALPHRLQDGALGLERNGDNDRVGSLSGLLVQAALNLCGDALAAQALGRGDGAGLVARTDEYRFTGQPEAQGQPHSLRPRASQDSQQWQPPVVCRVRRHYTTGATAGQTAAGSCRGL